MELLNDVAEGTLFAHVCGAIAGALILGFDGPVWAATISAFAPIAMTLGVAIAWLLYAEDEEETDEA